MKYGFLIIGLCLCVVSTVSAQNLFIVTDDPHLEVEGAGNLGDYLRGLGYTVTVDEGDPDQGTEAVSKYRGALDDDEIAHLESFDLVLIHRSTSSGSFDDDGAIEQWNALDVPILCGSSYLPRNDRWFWADADQVRTPATEITIVEPDHPIVAGLTGEVYDTALDIDHLGPGDVGEGTIVATIMQADEAEGTAIVVWEPDDAFADAGGQTHTQARIFVPFFRYHEDAGGTFENYTDNGLAMIHQAVEYGLTFSGTDVEEWTLY